MPPKGGQLEQARVYFRENPAVREITNARSSSTYIVKLWTGDEIRCGIISTSNLGLRVDGILYDEFEDLQIKQQIEIYPQMAGMMTASTIHKEVYLGTRWIATLFDEYVDQYPTMIRPWDDIPWLVESGMIQKKIDEGVTPEWEIDMLYRCIATAPSGLLFPQIYSLGEDFTYKQEEVRYGLDFGSKDMCVGVIIDGDDLLVVEEYAFELEQNHEVFDFLKGNSVEAESGGYNDSDKYAAKSILLGQRIGCKRQPVTNKWKSKRQMEARDFNIYCSRRRTPNTYSDIKGAQFDPSTGLYLKDNAHPCHWLDAFFHSIHKPTYEVWIEQIATNLDPNYVEFDDYGVI